MKKNIFLPLLLVLPLVGLSGCGGGENEDLKVSVMDDSQFLISAKTFSCSARKTGALIEDISSKFVQFSNVSFNWEETTTNLFISTILIEVISEDINGGKWTCPVAGSELLALNDTWYAAGKAVVGGPDITTPVSPEIPTGVLTPAKTVSISCPLTCGSIQTSARPFSATGTMKVIGYKVDAANVKTPVIRTSSVTIENLF